MTDDAYAFDQFPRGQLQFKFSRRGFLTALFTGAEVMWGKTDGRKALTLEQLGSYPDDALAEVMPVVTPRCVIFEQDGFVWGQPWGAVGPLRLFPLDSPALSAFNGFNGRNPLGEISADLAATTGWETQHSFDYVRGLFLTLVQIGVCQPQG